MYNDEDEVDLSVDPSWVRPALVKTAEFLRTKHPTAFDMSEPCLSTPTLDKDGLIPVVAPYSCGTVACIGGHAYLFKLGVDPLTIVSAEVAGEVAEFVTQYDCEETPLAKLFYPSELEGQWADILPEEAATAIDNYLAGNDEPWEGVFEGNLIPQRDRNPYRASGHDPDEFDPAHAIFEETD